MRYFSDEELEMHDGDWQWFCDPNQRVDYTDKDMRGARLSGTDLRGVNFTGANLESVEFTDTNIEGAVFTDAIIKNVVGAKLDAAGNIISTKTWAELHPHV